MDKKLLLEHGLTDAQSQQFERYFELLVEWNEKINLTAITEEYDVITKHFLDCLMCFDSKVIEDGVSVIDVGTGAGFPGIPLKIANPTLNVTLLDSLAKRLNFLNEVVGELKLNGITTVHARAEDGGRDKNLRQKFDVAVSRAVANLSTLSELCLPFVKVGGYFVSMKGPGAEDEIAAAKNAIKLLGGELQEVIHYHIPTTDLNHNLVIIKKIANTPDKYPRQAPKPAKMPLN
ncbi:MAG: 16S rRNA (guanine(527)-N(7))-methyltransferase RsmG [Clostridia bacterium]|nr:16S rRNA (guanine(527)-N(7))-methyltransferase RsmG [Clostridia bacterium]